MNQAIFKPRGDRRPRTEIDKPGKLEPCICGILKETELSRN